MKWISVKDRLPEDREIVLGYNEYSEILTVKFFFKTGEHFSVNLFFLYPERGCPCCGSCKQEDITHWMPLPAEPKD